jgi:hypothetical protein
MMKKVYVEQSIIHGNGLYTDVHRGPGEHICIGVYAHGGISYTASWINHSKVDNCELVYDSLFGTWNIWTNKSIPKGGELTLNYHNLPDFLEHPKEGWV